MAGKAISLVADPVGNMPNYGLVEAAYFLRVPVRTLRNWVRGQRYVTQSGHIASKPLIVPASTRPTLLSFRNLIEAHVLRAMTRYYKISPWKIRPALDTVEKTYKLQCPLLEIGYTTDGVDLLIEELGKHNPVNASRYGQLEIRETLRTFDRIEKDVRGVIERFYLWVESPEEPHRVEVNPLVAFGRPVIAGTGLPVDVVAGRWRAGDPPQFIADDYEINIDQVIGALGWELVGQAVQ